MTRLKLIPWLAIPVLLCAPVLPAAAAPNKQQVLTDRAAHPVAVAPQAAVKKAEVASPKAPAQNSDGLIYLPMEGTPAWLKGTAGLRTSTAGQVTLSPYGPADGNVGNPNGMISVRYDPPFNAPFTITGISFPTRVQLASIPDEGGTTACSAIDARHLVHAPGGTFFGDGVGVGVPLVGPGIPAGTFVTNVTATVITVNQDVTPDVAVSTPMWVHTWDDARDPAGWWCCAYDDPTNESATLHRCDPSDYSIDGGDFTADGVVVGDLVTGIGVRPGTQVTAVGTTTVDISPNAWMYVQVYAPYGHSELNWNHGPSGIGLRCDADGSNVLTIHEPGVTTFTSVGVTVGNYVVEDGYIYSPGTPPGTYVQSISTDGTQVTLNNNVAAGVSQVQVFCDPSTRTISHIQTRTFIPPSGNFVSVRVLGMDPLTGLPDKTQEFFQQRNVPVDRTGDLNTIPLNIAGTPGQTYFVVFQFPPPPPTGTFPFLYTDRQFTEAGLFAASFATDTSAAVKVPPLLGNPAGSALLIDQNVVCNMTCSLTAPAPPNPPTRTGLNVYRQHDGSYKSTWSFFLPDLTTLADGTPASGSTKIDGFQLVRLENGVWTVVDTQGNPGDYQLGDKKAPPGSASLRIDGPVPGSGLQIWGVWGITKISAKHPIPQHTTVSNVTITGATTVAGYVSALGEDADEPNGRPRHDELPAMTLPVVNRPETLWPAGEEDDYRLLAQRGQVINVTVDLPVGAYDFRNDARPVVRLLDKGGKVVAQATMADGDQTVSLSFTVAKKSLADYYVQVEDLSGSTDDYLDAPRVLVPCAYNLSVDVVTLAASLVGDGSPQAGSVPGADEFAFANAGANPVRGAATFRYVIPRSTSGDVAVRLRIYDVRGRVVNTLINGSVSAGAHFVGWSGRDGRGNRVAAGPYFARFEAGAFSRTVRINLMN